MTPEQQRIAIAEACGWRKWFNGWNKLDEPTPPFLLTSQIPDYLNDLNAMHEAERSLKGEYWTDYINNLIYVVDGGPPKEHMFMFYTATAAQRAEAFLHTIGKWTI